MGINTNEYLEKVLKTYRMSHIDNLVNKHKNRRDEIKKAIQDKYGSNAYTSFDSGSFAKHTAINIKFDLDIVAPFKRNSFKTLQEMFDDVYEYLMSKFGNEAQIRKQKVSLGVKFNKDSDGDYINIDVVPGRELNNDDYITTRDLNLYFNEDHWGIGRGTLTKTNIQSQIDHIKNKSNERSVIRLLKIWKHTNNESYKSFLFELITIKAFSQKNISGSIWEMLKQVIEYIKDNIEKENLSLVDPGNSGNDIVKKMTSHERDILAMKMRNILNRVDENNENIKYYFPINESFTIKADTDNSYGQKNGTSSFSVPPNNERFG